MNPADPLRVGSDVVVLNDGERDAVIKVGLAGGTILRHQLGGAVLAALLRARLLVEAGTGTVALTARRVRALAEAATNA
jgi:hypothetical protein